ncbi:MAG: RluA family pseudouridine synthase [Oscillospiraceae bacterium]|nr:RluA family pseudouridine synthase [Oscillospiraceae bacterium]
MELKILYEDAQLAVCLKPPGMLSEEEGMPKRLCEVLDGDFFCVHRLDKAVGGVMVYARTREAAAALSAAVAAGAMHKSYLAVVQGVPERPKGSFRDLLYHDAARNKSYVVTRPRRGVREALLDYELLGSAEYDGLRLSALRIELHTGRSHQIRVQFASRGMPLAGDGRYGSAVHSCPIALWSEALVFPHPRDGREVSYSSLPPASFPWTLFCLHNI